MSEDRVNVLLVEDSPSDAQLLCESLRDYPVQRFEIERAERLDEAVAFLARKSFDVILLDLNLPDSRSLETCRRISRAAGQVPIIILTGADDEAIAAEAMRLGVQDYLVKGQTHGGVIGRTIRYAVERGQSQQALREVNERLQEQAEELQSQAEERQTQAEELQAQAEELTAVNATLRESEERLHLAMESGRVGVWEWEVGTERVKWSQGFYALLGCKPGDVAPTREAFRQRIYPQDRHRQEQALRESMERCEDYFCEFRVVWIDGSVHWVEDRGQYAYVESGNGVIPWMRGALSDIDRRKQAEEALRESEERHRRLIENLKGSHFIYQHDTRGVFQYLSESLPDILGYTPEEFMAHYSKYMTDHPANQAVHRHTELSIQGIRQPPYEVNIWHKDGSSRWLEVQEVPVSDATGQVIAVEGVAQDITERKRAEEALRASEQRLKRAQEIAHLGSWELDLTNNHLSWSDEVYRIFGLPPQESGASYEAFLASVHPDDREAVDAAYSGSLREGKDTYEIDHRVVRRSTGEIRIVHEKCEHLRDESGQIVRSMGMVQDITDRKRAEEALRESEERYHRLFEDDLTGDFISTPEGRILLCNPAFAEMFGFSSAQEAVGTSILDLYFDAGEREPLLERLKQEGRIGRFEVWRKRRDGNPIYIVENLVGHFNDRGELYEIKGYLLDDTERKRADEALRELTATLESKVAERTAQLEHRARQLQKLTLDMSEAEDRERRRLAEILHDDLQQVLAAAKFHLNLMKHRARHDASLQATALQIDQMLSDAIEKSRSLSHELSPAVLHHGDLAETLGWLANQIQAKHGLVVHVHAHGEVALQSDALKGFLYKAAQELLFNVVKHARVQEARIRVRRFGRYIGLSVSDRGRGFDPQELREAAGFGLLSIRERIELLGGRMKIHSAKGRGSTFHIVVPDSPALENVAGAGPRARPTSGEARPGDHTGSPLRVLVADDHEIVREGLISLLREERAVEVVGEAANGREAVDLAGRLKPDVVIMDVSMPLIDGDDATRQIKTHLPKTRVVALSMYEEPETIERMYRAGAEGYVLKTAPSEKLLAAIRGETAPP